ncbi:hypothetical protein MATL_G00241290 [Megalops atlanticus]|uniref:Uncharacterized protein n=1 Tax=Megalops atlanticus TaxID=7932 RepID=A0A9D3PEV7_MEGAT|nr:hypothetical protein MATL_G00241290 [Megalops atlanticus]
MFFFLVLVGYFSLSYGQFTTPGPETTAVATMIFTTPPSTDPTTATPQTTTATTPGFTITTTPAYTTTSTTHSVTTPTTTTTTVQVSLPVVVGLRASVTSTVELNQETIQPFITQLSYIIPQYLIGPYRITVKNIRPA